MILRYELAWLTRHFKAYPVPLNVCGSVVAHEYRHHLQAWRHGLWSVPHGMEGDFDLLSRYYKSCKQGHDAMMFERSMDVCNGESDYWFSLLDIPRSRARALLLP